MNLWERSEIKRSHEGREWIEINCGGRLICEISNEYLCVPHLDQTDEDDADLIICAVNQYLRSSDHD